MKSHTSAQSSHLFWFQWFYYSSTQNWFLSFIFSSSFFFFHFLWLDAFGYVTSHLKTPSPHSFFVFVFPALFLAAIKLVRNFDNSFSKIFFFWESYWAKTSGVSFEQGFCQEMCFDGRSASSASVQSSEPGRQAVHHKSPGWSLSVSQDSSLLLPTIEGDVESYKDLGLSNRVITQVLLVTWSDFNLNVFFLCQLQWANNMFISLPIAASFSVPSRGLVLPL